MRNCRLQFAGVGEKRTGYRFRARKKNNRSDANDNTYQLPTLGPPSTSSVTAARQHPSAYANRLAIGGGLERGGRHGLKPMLRPPSTSSVTAARQRPSAYANRLAIGGGLERSGRHGLKPMLRPPSTSSGTPNSNTDRKSTRLNSSHLVISYAVFCL